MLNEKENETILWEGPDVREQTSPIIPDTTYRPEFSEDECEALRTGTCPLESESIDADTPCGKLCMDLISGITPDSPVSILHDKMKNLAVFKAGRHIACVFAHIAAEHPDLVVPTIVRNCRLYSERARDIIIITKGSFTMYGGLIPVLLMKNERQERKLERASQKTRFTFPPSLAERKIEFAHGEYVVAYDTRWTILNPEAAYDSGYAYLSYMHKHTDNWPEDSRERPSIYFTDTADLEKAYDEIKALDTAWFPGTTDRIVESEYTSGEPRKVTAARG